MKNRRYFIDLNTQQIQSEFDSRVTDLNKNFWQFINFTCFLIGVITFFFVAILLLHGFTNAAIGSLLIVGLLILGMIVYINRDRKKIIRRSREAHFDLWSNLYR